MARYPRPHRSLIRRAAVLLTLVMAGGGLVALEHTATGASTGTPSCSYNHDSTSNSCQQGNNDGDHHDHGSTTTTMPGNRHDCDDEHGRNHKDRFKCRQPSGGQNPHNHHDSDNDGDSD